MGQKKTLLIAASIIMSAVIAVYIFYRVLFPKIAADFLMGKNAPEFAEQINLHITEKAKPLKIELEMKGISTETVKTAVMDLSYSDLAGISAELRKEGFKSKSACAEILLSTAEIPEPEENKIKQILVKNIDLKKLKEAAEEFDSANPATVKALIPVVKEITVKALETE